MAQRVATLSARVTELMRRVASIEAGDARTEVNSPTTTNVYAPEEWSHPIEFLTDNGFVIVRPWETNGSPAPADGRCRFEVIDPNGHERNVTVNISHRLMCETAIKTSRRIAPTDSFWICCAERRLAGYVEEHDAFPEGNEITVAEFDREDLLLAIRWGKSD